MGIGAGMLREAQSRLATHLLPGPKHARDGDMEPGPSLWLGNPILVTHLHTRTHSHMQK